MLVDPSVSVGEVEVETVSCGEVLLVKPVGVVEVEKVPCKGLLVVVPVEEVLIEVVKVPCGVILVVVPVGVVEVISGLFSITHVYFFGNAYP